MKNNTLNTKYASAFLPTTIMSGTIKTHFLHLPERPKDPQDPMTKDLGVVNTAKKEQPVQSAESEKTTLCRDMAATFLRKEGRFYLRAQPTVSLSSADLKRVALNRFSEKYPNISLTDDLWREVHQYSVEDFHTDRSQSIPVWTGVQECHPETADGLFWEDGIATLNSWTEPAYRSLGITDQDSSMFDQLLDRVFPQAVDRSVFKDWLSWNLQNEGDKPTWCILLYSASKGTGKSTLVLLLSLLFGKQNSIPLNGISKLTGRFNQTIMTKKFVSCEEVKLKIGTDQGNTIKAFISEKEVAVEAKGKEVEPLRNVCAFVMTTNHFAHWVESDDRRFYVIDANHPGHASGPDRREFQSFMAEFHDYMQSPANIARLYNSLMARSQANSFDAKSLNIAAIDTPVMRRINEASGEILLQELAEVIAARKVFAIAQTDVRRLFTESLKANPNRLAHLMNELGWLSTSAKWGGVDHARVIWVHPDYQVSGGRVLGPDGYDAAVGAALPDTVIDLEAADY